MLLNKIVYIHSENLISHCNKLPSMQNRASVVQDLINSYRLLISSNVAVVKSQDATEEELKSFHSTDYIDLLKSLNSWDSNIDEINDDHLSYGLGYDCPVLDNIYDFACSVAGGSLTAAKLLAAKKCQIVINWFGGWHHANRDFASGFCYINDVVIAIQHLTKTFKRPLYLDLDIHHGDGVQNAFEFSNRILTLSFHKYCPGFFPNTGSSEEKGKGKGTYYSLNVPLKDGIKNQNYIEVFNSIFPLVISKFKPDVLIVQCGADGLNGDSVGECNLTLRGIGECIEKVLACTLPTLFLGGGGYNIPNTARLWTYLTSLIIDKNLDNDIPDASEYFTEYEPTYQLHIEEGRRKDLNTKEYLKQVVEKIQFYCNSIPESEGQQ